ncbi:glycoside hydrolase family 2 protein [Marinilabilia salmonicolor]|uniref:Glycosyl hydrolase family 2 n=1 Tax=Marinilabilia salmonicolor TaxID=989 RepID=A0A2T0XEI7_9BACT|nr:sugar-binding domain-containing protein [Marinilabilia salmonicolor]PRY97337.1 glycosyl hydrolase family 2 [Marinilabilia salmonicolor]RCW36842.1 glycosyl hydrolase family 2 [Marinilabilia salmonicolor]
MLRRTLLIFSVLMIMGINSQSQWKPAGENIKTSWGKEIDPQNVLPEYPRPIMERSEWQNLNGLWEYAIEPVKNSQPYSFDGQILVPFAIESSLSGVQKRVGSENVIWYKRLFEVPTNWTEKKVLLHFGAVDWKTDIWVNDIKVGTHEGGYTPFSFDIAPFLSEDGDQELVVRVWDPTDKGPQPRGKQVSNPEGIWYTPVSGIWQTVWLEPVAKTYISSIRTTPDIDMNCVSIETDVFGNKYGDVVSVTVKADGEIVTVASASVTHPLELKLENPKLWSPDSPFLYDMEITLMRDGEIMDTVKSYFAMRKISMKRDAQGIVRLQLNNKNIFHFGPLDQGWWPDGLYTAPSDDALKYDIQKTRDLGFNMIRKHVKVEPARWYTHCDRLGIMVWQDMPNGDSGPEWQNRSYFDGMEFQRTARSEEIFRKEWKDIIDYLYSYPSIAVWVPFNERWGQFKTEEIAAWSKTYDPTRLVNPASGGNHYQVGDMLDLHNYPEPELYLYDAVRATVLGEYGGIGLAVKGHLWAKDRNWGYVQFKTSKEVTEEYIRFAKKLEKLVKAGFSAAVYTQTTDVEMEVNGLMTYDREVVKVDEEKVRKINQEVIGVVEK